MAVGGFQWAIVVAARRFGLSGDLAGVPRSAWRVIVRWTSRRSPFTAVATPTDALGLCATGGVGTEAELKNRYPLSAPAKATADAAASATRIYAARAPWRSRDPVATSSR